MRKRPTEGAKIITSPSITKNTVRTRRRAERLRRTGGRAIRFIIVTIAWPAAREPSPSAGRGPALRPLPPEGEGRVRVAETDSEGAGVRGKTLTRPSPGERSRRITD